MRQGPPARRQTGSERREGGAPAIETGGSEKAASARGMHVSLMRGCSGGRKTRPEGRDYHVSDKTGFEAHGVLSSAGDQDIRPGSEGCPLLAAEPPLPAIPA